MNSLEVTLFLNDLQLLCLHTNGFKYCYQTLISKVVNLATVVEGDPKAPFSIATTPSCRGGHYTFPWIAPLYS